MAMQTPAPVEYSRATSMDDAIAQMAALGGNARFLAGGHSLIPMMKLRLADPGHLIDLNPIEPELNYIRQEGDEIVIGAMTRHRDMLESELLGQHFPIFFEAEHVLADPVVRNRGTMGGSMCQADPAEDLSGVVTALKGIAVLRGPGGAERTVGMHEFHIGPYMTAVQPTELLKEVRFKLKPGGGSAHEKVERRAGDFAIVAASAALWVENGVITDAGLACSAVGPTTMQIDARRGHDARPGTVGAAVRAGRRHRVAGLLAERGRPRAGRLQAPRCGRAQQARPREGRRARGPIGGL